MSEEDWKAAWRVALAASDQGTPALTASDEDVDSDIEIASMASPEADACLEEPGVELESEPVEQDDTPAAACVEEDLESEPEQDAAAAAASAAPRSREKPGRRKSSKYFGVTRHGQKYRAQIRENGATRYIGRFSSGLKAAKAFDARCREIGRLDTLNFPTADEAAAAAESLLAAREARPWYGRSKYVGVYRHEDVFVAKIWNEGSERLGRFSSEVEAAKAYDARARQIGRLSRLNFPTDDELETHSRRSSRPSASSASPPAKRTKRAAKIKARDALQKELKTTFEGQPEPDWDVSSSSSSSSDDEYEEGLEDV